MSIMDIYLAALEEWDYEVEMAARWKRTWKQVVDDQEQADLEDASWRRTMELCVDAQRKADRKAAPLLLKQLDEEKWDRTWKRLAEDQRKAHAEDAGLFAQMWAHGYEEND